MKQQGLIKGTGKLGSVVFSQVGGETIVREYQPNVSNPSTQPQVDQRAKMKLITQVAAALAPAIAIPRSGLKSSRNLFVSKNFDAVSANGGVAQLTYENLQLTNGSAGLPAIYASRSVESGISIQLSEAADAAVSRVVYIAYKKTSEDQLQYIQSVIAESAGGTGTFPATLPYAADDVVLYAYGMKDLSSRASAKYGNYAVNSGLDIARLVMSRAISTSDFQLTQTRGTTLFAGATETVVVGENQSRVFVTPSGNGTVTGAGVYDNGSTVTVSASPALGSRFVGWRDNGTNNIVSTNAVYSFTINQQVDLVAVFQAIAGATVYTIQLAETDPEEGTATISATQVMAGDSVTLTASPGEEYDFLDWQDGDTGDILSRTTPFTFTPTKNMYIIPEFTMASPV